MEIVLYVLGAIGLTHIMVDSKVMLPVRNWLQEPYYPPLYTFFKTLFTHPSIWVYEHIIKTVSQIISCYQCCGFWCGLFVGWSVLDNATFFKVLTAGFAGSFLSNFAAIFLNYLEAQTIVHLDSKE